MSLLAEEWNKRYLHSNTPWDLGQPSEELRYRLSELPLHHQARILVPGCGRGHDAALLAEAGFDVTGIDWSEEAVAQARQRYGKRVHFFAGNAFTQPWDAPFDAVFEHTFFCALSPADWPQYGTWLTQVLAPDGLLFGIFWNHGQAGGPPYSVTPQQLHALLASGPLGPLTWQPLAKGHPNRQQEFWVTAKAQPPEAS